MSDSTWMTGNVDTTGIGGGPGADLRNVTAIEWPDAPASEHPALAAEGTEHAPLDVTQTGHLSVIDTTGPMGAVVHPEVVVDQPVAEEAVTEEVVAEEVPEPEVEVVAEAVEPEPEPVVEEAVAEEAPAPKEPAAPRGRGKAAK